MSSLPAHSLFALSASAPWFLLRRLAWGAWLGVFGLALASATPSSSWGRAGENWTPTGALPDFSFAGYHCGEQPVPELPVVTDVRQHGARGDGVTDDSAAFNRALATARAGAVLVPAGRYLIRDWVRLTHSGTVLRGEGPEKSVLVFDRTLTDVQPNWGATTSGQRTSNYSWGGGFVVFQGAVRRPRLAPITATAARGERWLTLATVDALAPGRWVEVAVADDAGRSLTAYLYGGDPGRTAKLRPLRTRQVARVVAVEAAGRRVQLDRPLRFPTRAEWQPALHAFEPGLTECGVEQLGFEFPAEPWRGEFQELGYNAIDLADAAHCWVRAVRIVNAESGIYLRGVHNTIDGVVLTATKPVYPKNKYLSADGCIGHHGIATYGADNLIQHFDFRANYVHDLTVEGPGAAGNVFKQGRGCDLCFDHHKMAPHANLFGPLDSGAGNRLWRCGGGDALGRQSGGWETFWAVRAARPLSPPPVGWGPASMIIVGVAADRTPPPGRDPALAPPWIELIPAAELEPQDLHASQLARRLAARP